jgi:hypothetical protein
MYQTSTIRVYIFANGSAEKCCFLVIVGVRHNLREKEEQKSKDRLLALGSSIGLLNFEPPQVYPNESHEFTSIGFHLPSTCKSDLLR